MARLHPLHDAARALPRELRGQRPQRTLQVLTSCWEGFANVRLKKKTSARFGLCALSVPIFAHSAFSEIVSYERFFVFFRILRAILTNC